MKKFFTSLFLVVFAVLMLQVTKAANDPLADMPANCIAANDGCNSCARSIGGDWACTKMRCSPESMKTPACTKYADEPVACTMEYAPVCAKVQVMCITTPCNPVYETFGNRCMMNTNKNATFAYNGECRAGLDAGEGYLYDKMASFLDKGYFTWQFTPLQAINYTQTIVEKIDDKLEKSRMKKWAYEKHVQLKKWLQLYITSKQISQ